MACGGFNRCGLWTQNTYFVAVRLKLDAILETKEFSIADIDRVIHEFLEDFDRLSSVSLESFSSSFCSKSCEKSNTTRILC